MTKEEIFDKLCETENTLEKSLAFIRFLKTEISNDFKLSAVNIKEIPIEDFFSLKFNFVYPQNKSIIKALDWIDIKTVGDLLNCKRLASVNDLSCLRGMGKTKVEAVRQHLERYGLAIGKQDSNNRM